MVGDGGFEPPKRDATDLQSAPFDRLGNLPYTTLNDIFQPKDKYSQNLGWSWWRDLNPRPIDYKSIALPTELHQRMHISHAFKHIIYQNRCQHPKNNLFLS